ncbi:hypothetical protein WJX75_004131 [Coccomyxa subellipsoidea]|uniref:Uncharacterized protein n=1 Tax=Coccomyxa subellipsoidea TaxID=248742 RepID=A0ABR2Z2N8_9CHLO
MFDGKSFAKLLSTPARPGSKKVSVYVHIPLHMAARRRKEKQQRTSRQFACTREPYRASCELALKLAAEMHSAKAIVLGRMSPKEYIAGVDLSLGAHTGGRWRSS